MNKNVIMLIVSLLSAIIVDAQQEKGTFTDERDGQVYKWVKIGDQVWMVENLAYKATSNCWAYDNDPKKVTDYGYLYGWETAKTICPSGWHVPSASEWTTLTDYLGGPSTAGGKMKEAGTTHWNPPNAGATNESGFSGLPGGGHYYSGAYYDIGSKGYWWSSTDVDTDIAMFFRLKFDSGAAEELGNSKRVALSVRCLRD
jgi:uncharacterized protein (TIGR02145 family)